VDVNRENAKNGDDRSSKLLFGFFLARVRARVRVKVENGYNG
jgi:hypothetical protein